MQGHEKNGHTAEKSWLDSSAIAVVGARGSGKTALSYKLCTDIAATGRPVHVYRNPRPELIRERGWNHMQRLEEIYDVHHCAVWVDEIQLTIPTLDKRANDGLQRLLSIARHRDITLIMSTCDTRWVTRALESWIDVWLVKDIEISLVKQGSMLKKIARRHVVVDVDEFRLRPEQYLFYARDFPEQDGLHEFEMPKFFSDAHSKPWAIRDESATVTAKVTANGSANGKVKV